MRDYPAYADYITFNDDVAAENIRFLLMVYQSLGEARVRPAILRAGESLPRHPAADAAARLGPAAHARPQARRRAHLRAAVARHPHHRRQSPAADEILPADRRRTLPRPHPRGARLARIAPPAARSRRGRAAATFPTFIEIGTNRPLYVHRRGSNVVNGAYYWDYSPEAPLGHYGAFRAIDIAALRRDYADAARDAARGDAARTRRSRAPGHAPLPRFIVTGLEVGSDLNAAAAGQRRPRRSARLNAEGWWPTPLRATSNPYRGPGPRRPPPGDYRTTHVGDASDTSPYPTDRPVTGISTATYIANMAMLIRALEERR